MTQKLWSYKIKVYSTLLMQLWMCLEWFQFYGGEHFQHVLEVQTVEVVPSYVTCAHSDLVRKTPWLSTVLQSTSVDNRLLVLFRRQETIPICLLGWHLAELHASTPPPNALQSALCFTPHPRVRCGRAQTFLPSWQLLFVILANLTHCQLLFQFQHSPYNIKKKKNHEWRRTDTQIKKMTLRHSA